MKFLRENISWIAPTAAILVVGAAYVVGEGGFSFLSSEQEAPKVDLAEAQQQNLSTLQTVVDAAATNVVETPAPTQGSQVVATLNAIQPTAEAVTRNVPVDLLQVAPKPAPKPAAVAVAPQSDFNQQNAADFFNSAQSRLAVDNACGEDLKALADQARIYFPAGGLSGEDSGFNAARLIGQVARDCPGFSVQVEGHSDPSGNPETNKRLSKQRAEAVIQRLAASGLDTTNFFAVGFGDTQPSRVRGPKGSAYYDRRVEFSVVETEQRVRFTTQSQPWTSAGPACMTNLETQARQLRQYYSPGSITVPTADLDAVYSLAADVARCDGARLRLVGQHEDAPGSREDVATGRLRALAMMSTLVSAGFPSDQILVGAPSYSIDVPGQPGLPNSRIDFQVIAD